MTPRATITTTPSVSTTWSPPTSPRTRSPTTPSSSSRRSSGRTSSSTSTTGTSRYPKWHPAVLERTVNYVKEDFAKVVSQSPFLQTAEPAPHIALFSRSEIQTGRRLGKGGFSNVYEITGFTLDQENISSKLSPRQAELRLHYQRQVASSKDGKSRFVLKHLQERLLAQPKAFAHAASDLAVEAAYMSSLNHANICKVRGLPVEGLSAIGGSSSSSSDNSRIHDGYFIILDRLQDTLDQRIEQEWKKAAPCSVEEKTRYALQIASALSHLHDRRIVFRDLKPANIGIDIHGSVQLFDFGLCRELPAPCALSMRANKNQQQQHDGESSFDYRDTDHHRHHDCDEVFEMSGVGTRRYMAVEIINTRRYNCKADVFGWAMVFYEMLSLEKPFPSYSCQDHQLFVCQSGERPQLQQVYDMNMDDDSCDRRYHAPPESLAMIGHALEQSWCESVCDRYSMKQVRQTLMQILGSYHTRPIVNVDTMPASPVAVNDVFLLCPELEYYDSEDDEAQGDGCSLVTADFRDDEPTTTQERCQGQEVLLLQNHYTSSPVLKPMPPPSMPAADDDHHGIPSHLFLPDIQAMTSPSGEGDEEASENENEANYDDAPASVAYRRPTFNELQQFFS